MSLAIYRDVLAMGMFESRPTLLSEKSADKRVHGLGVLGERRTMEKQKIVRAPQ
jgi:hypothetical protein